MINAIKSELLSKLKQEHCFWSYNEESIKDISDEILIEKTLLHLDLAGTTVAPLLPPHLL